MKPLVFSSRVHAGQLLVDDGIATGSTIRAAVQALRQQRPKQIIIAAPETSAELKPLVDDLVLLTTPEDFRGVGRWYEDFSQTMDDEVTHALAAAAHLEPQSMPVS